MSDLPRNLIIPAPDDDEGTPQKPTKRLPFTKGKVRTKPSRRDRREFKRALEQPDEAS